MTDKDIDKKLKKMEEQLDAITSSLASSTPESRIPNPDSRFPPLDSRFPAASRSDEIDLRELFMILWQGKWIIIAVTFLFAVAGVFYALSLPNMYKSEGVYAPAQKQGSGGLSGQLGGLASLAGVNIGGGESNDIDQAMVLIKSWPFLERVINKHNLKPLIMGVKGWNRETGEVIWNEEVYDPVNKKWLREVAKGQKAEPSSYETFDAFQKAININNDKKTGMLKVAVEFYSPVLAKQWVDILIAEINQTFRQRDTSDAQKNIDYLNQKINETSIAQMQSVFYGMIESQTKTLMLAEVGGEYLLREVVVPTIPDKKSKPSRAAICILAVILGSLFSCFIVLILGFLPRDRSKK